MSHSDTEQRRRGFESLLHCVATAGVIAGGMLLLAVSILVIVEITLRKFFGTSIQGVDELSSYAMALAFAWAMPFAILDRAHIRIEQLLGEERRAGSRPVLTLRSSTSDRRCRAGSSRARLQTGPLVLPF